MRFLFEFVLRSFSVSCSDRVKRRITGGVDAVEAAGIGKEERNNVTAQCRRITPFIVNRVQIAGSRAGSLRGTNRIPCIRIRPPCPEEIRLLAFRP